ncbi:MAG: thioredoxin family protein [Nitrospirota bacterium]
MYLVKGLCLCLIIFLGFGCSRGIAPKEEINPQIDSAIQQETGREDSVQKSLKLQQDNPLLPEVIPSPKETPQVEVKEKEEIKVVEPNQGENPSIQQEPMENETKEIKWYFSFEEGLKASKEEGKPLMVDFEASWCGWCKKLDETTYKDTQVIALSKKFIPVKVDCDTDRVTPQKYGVRGLPTIIFMDSAGQILHQIVGYRGAEGFALEMKKVVNGN